MQETFVVSFGPDHMFLFSLGEFLERPASFLYEIRRHESYGGSYI